MKRPRTAFLVALGVVAIGAGLALTMSGAGRHVLRPAGPAPIPTPVATASTRSGAMSSGCGGSSSKARGIAYRTASGRTFHVWGPSSYDAARPYPVVLAFHGWYTKGRDFEEWFKMEDYVDGSAFVVYPDANGTAWDIHGASDLDFTGDVVEAMSNAYCIDRTRVFALGFSYGGKMVHHLGCKRPDLVRAISVGDGSWAADSGCAAVPVLVTHRTDDHDELIAWGRDAAKRWSVIDGCSAATEPTNPAHGCFRYLGCSTPGGVTFCEDTHFDPAWPPAWNHTIRDEYRRLTWQWFESAR